MKDANHALDVLTRKSGIGSPGFDANGQIGIDVSPGLTVFLTRTDETLIEASCLLASLDYPDAAMMRAMLEANFLGGGVGAGRLALDADKSEVILCECWHVTEMDAAVLEARFDAFCRAAAFWMDEGSTLLLEQAGVLRREDEAVLPMADSDEEPPILMRL